MMVASVSRP
ncbi:hypothetical protein D047_3030A, partial [Vibrio parahaemolyticus VPTS-2010_2]